MTAHDTSSERSGDLIAAAQAAASWAHARRATWTSAPLPAIEIASTVPAAAPVVEAPHPVASPPPPEAPVPDRHRTPTANVVAWITKSVDAFGAPVRRWLARAAVVAALGAVGVVGVPRLLKVVPASLPSRPATVEPADTRPPVAPARRTGGLAVSSTPPGAQVLLDGKPRGVTPLSLTDLTPGRHEVVLRSAAGTVRRTVTVAANETAAVDEAIFSGWVALYAPFEVVISEAGRVLPPDEHNQIMLSPGAHDLRVINRGLAYDTVQRVDVKPGEVTNVRLSPEPSMLTVTASDAAEVWLDGARLGDTPMNAAPVSIGTHEIVVKRASGGERRFSVTIGAKPFSLNVDFSSQQDEGGAAGRIEPS